MRMTEGLRVAALRYVVANARVYLQQLDVSAGELGELRATDLADLLEAVRRAQAATEAVDKLGTQLLRSEP